MKLEGSPRTRYVLASSILASIATGNVSLCSARNGVTRAGSESTETASITKPCSLYRRCSRSIAGISSRHGAHHVAQKLIKTRSEEHTSELQSRFDLVCRLLLEKK